MVKQPIDPFVWVLIATLWTIFCILFGQLVRTLVDYRVSSGIFFHCRNCGCMILWGNLRHHTVRCKRGENA